jgi:hypothetical protein
MTKSKSNSVTESPYDRAAKIQEAMAEIGFLIDEKDRVRGRLRDSLNRMKRDLDLPPGDVIMAFRLQRMAAQRKEKTLDNVREIMYALGDQVRALSVTSAPAVQPEGLSQREAKIYSAISAGARNRAGVSKLVDIPTDQVSAYLSALKGKGLVVNDDDGNWSAT